MKIINTPQKSMTPLTDKEKKHMKIKKFVIYAKKEFCKYKKSKYYKNF